MILKQKFASGASEQILCADNYAAMAFTDWLYMFSSSLKFLEPQTLLN